MTWYAVRTSPGSQMPQREYAVETTKSAKGYRIIPSLDPRYSAVEKALTDAGIVHYMPAEKRLIRDRRHTDLWKPRRFALLVGYVFIYSDGPVDWFKLLGRPPDIPGVPGVAGVVSVEGRPMPIPLSDILMLRSMEAVGEEKFDKDAKRARSILKGKAKRDPRLQKLVNKLQAQDVATVPLTSLLAA